MMLELVIPVHYDRSRAWDSTGYVLLATTSNQTQSDVLCLDMWLGADCLVLPVPTGRDIGT